MGAPFRRQLLVIPLLFSFVALTYCNRPPGHPGKVLDEALRVKRAPNSFPAADEDYFRDMDGGISLNSAEVKGRNMWIVWTGGNDRFWDGLSVSSVGNLDFLK